MKNVTLCYGGNRPAVDAEKPKCICCDSIIRGGRQAHSSTGAVRRWLDKRSRRSDTRFQNVLGVKAFWHVATSTHSKRFEFWKNLKLLRTRVDSFFDIFFFDADAAERRHENVSQYFLHSFHGVLSQFFTLGWQNPRTPTPRGVLP